MKQLFRILTVTIMLLSVGCIDDDLYNRLDNLEERVSKLEELCREMNTNISSLQTIVTALQTNDYVTAVTPIVEDGKTVGYTISFVKSDPITIYHGKDGYTPVIGVRQDSDGIYYWTLDGDWLLDADGNKIKAQGIDGKDGITPQLKIEGESWYISYDNGECWSQLGKATGEDGKDGQNGQDGKDGKDGDSFFKSVTQDEENVYFELADGTVITLPKGTALNITFDEADLVVMSTKSTRSIGYTVSSMTDKVTVEVTSSADIKAKVIPTDNSGMTGSIQVTTGNAIDEYSKVIVFVSNGDKVIMRSITFEEAGLVVEDNATKQAPAEGGEVVLEFLTNVKCEASIPEEAKEWISVVPATRAMEKQAITLKLEPNEGATRSAEVQVKSVDGSLSLTYTIEQEPNLDYQLALEREALIAIYKALDGDNWINNENWCSDKPVSEWYGVDTHLLHGYVYQINLVNNGLKGDMPSELYALKYLYGLYFGGSDNCIRSFPKGISALSKLERLELSAVSEFPLEEILAMEQMYSISLDLTKANIQGVEVNFDKWENIWSVYISVNKSNNIELPKDFSACKNLTTLYLSGFSGTISPTIGECKQLISIGITNGLVTGEIPPEIGSLQNLDALVLNNNQLSGGIPKEIFNCPLTFLELQNNNLSGEIPEQLADWLTFRQESVFATGSIKCYLYNNNLTSIPKSIQNHPLWKVIWPNIITENKFNIEEISLPGLNLKGCDIKGNAFDSDIDYAKFDYTIVWYLPYIYLDKNVLFNRKYMNKLYDKYRNLNVNFLYISHEADSEDELYNFQENNYMPWRVFCNNLNAKKFKINYGNTTTYLPILFYDDFFNDDVHRVNQVSVINKGGNLVYNTLLNGESHEQLNIFLANTLCGGYYQSIDYSQDGVVTTLQTAAKGNGIDIVLMGDAYSDRQIADGTYRTDVEYIYNNLFTEEPYKSFKDYFNVHYVDVVSATEGYEYGDTALDGYFGDGTLVGGNDNAVFNYALNAISEHNMDEALIIVAMNSDNYAGTCYMYYPDNSAGYGNGVSVSYFPRGGDATTFAQLLHHEACGHGFAKLADEYAYDYMGTIPDSDVNAYKTQQADWGWWKNVDFTNDLSQIRWSRFLNDSRYQYDGLGAYEGGLTYWSGVWRPTENSIMRYNTGGFNAPSREAIYYRIHKLAYGDSWQYDYEEFVEWDARNRKAEADMSRAPYRAPANFKHTAPPVVVNKSWRDAK